MQTAHFSFILYERRLKPLMISSTEREMSAGPFVSPPDRETSMVFGVNLRNWEVACQVPLRRLQQFQ